LTMGMYDMARLGGVDLQCDVTESVILGV